MKNRLLPLVVLLLLLAGTAPASAPAEGYNVLLITLDTTRADHLGCYGFAKAETPNLDALAGAGVRFADCYTPVPLTLPAHCSLFTGETPLGHGVRNNATYTLGDDRLTMAEILKGRGYATYAAVAAYVLFAKFGVGQGFDVFDDSLNLADMSNGFTSEIPAGAVFEKFRVWFAGAWQKKFFAWIHLYDPHQPYAPPAPYAERFRRDPYSGEIAYMDSVIGRILAELKARGVLERTLVIAVGDHGEDLGEHKEYGHGTFCYDVTLRVPLIVSAPRLFSPRVVSGRVNLIDVLPTLCDLLGLPAGPGFQGASLKEALTGGALPGSLAGRDMYFESLYALDEMGWSPLAGLLSGPFKFIRLPESELYDLARDPGETENLFFKKNLQARDLGKKLQALEARLATAGDSGRRALNEADRRHLASLGYLSSMARSEKPIDPKRGNAVKDQLRTVKKLIMDKELDQAESSLKRLMADNPDIQTPIYYDMFEEIYKAKRDQKDLIAMQAKGTEVFPGNNQLKYNLASNLFNFQDLDGAEKWLQKIIANNPAYTRAYSLLGNIRFTQNRLGEALAYYEKALALEPQNLAMKKRIATIAARNGDNARALALLDELAGDPRLREDDEGRDFLLDVASRYAELGRPEPGLALLKGLLERRPKDAKVWNELGSVQARGRDFAAARKSFAQALAADPNFAPAYGSLGTLQLSQALQDRDAVGLKAAGASFDRAIALDPGLALAYNGRAAVMRFLNRVPEAIADWKKALELDPQLRDAYFNLGITYLETGDKAAALAVFRRCQEELSLRLSPAEQNRLQRLMREAGGI
jgi:arylsulfatase A-like enzyme/predicted Zn-dependent protease